VGQLAERRGEDVQIIKPLRSAVQGEKKERKAARIDISIEDTRLPPGRNRIEPFCY